MPLAFTGHAHVNVGAVPISVRLDLSNARELVKEERRSFQRALMWRNSQQKPSEVFVLSTCSQQNRMGVSINRVPQNGPQYVMILFIWTAKNGPQFLETHG